LICFSDVKPVHKLDTMVAFWRSFVRPHSARTFAAKSQLESWLPVEVASPWGTDGWRHSKAAFKEWANKAVSPSITREKREFYGFCALAFGDVDTDKDGFINFEQFDRLLEKVAAVPRRFGLAPVSMGSPLERQMAHKQVFDELDSRHGPARGVLGLDQFVEWAFEHVISKVGKVPAKDVGLYQVQDYSEDEYLDFVKRAVNNPGSYEHASFYNFVLNCFVEADAQCEGRIKYDQFDKLLSRSASVPRHFGLAPMQSSAETRKKMFDDLELIRGGTHTGYVTARTFWEWTTAHVKYMIDLQEAGKGWRETH